MGPGVSNPSAPFLSLALPLRRLCGKNVCKKKFLTPVRVRVILSNRTRRYLSWIEDLTTNQGVIGSNPIRRTTNLRARRVYRLAFLLTMTRTQTYDLSTVFLQPLRTGPIRYANSRAQRLVCIRNSPCVTEIHEINEGMLAIFEVHAKSGTDICTWIPLP